MPIDPVLAAYSDDLYLGAVAVYVIAMFLHAFEFVGNRKPMRAKTLVATSGDEVTGSTDETPGPAERVGRTRSDKCGRMGVSVTIVGLLLHVAAIVLRGFATERWPLGNMYEFTSAICLAAVVCWLVVLRRSPSLRPVGAFVLPPVLILMFLGGTVLYAHAAPVVPARQHPVPAGQGREGRQTGRQAPGCRRPRPARLPGHRRRLPHLHLRRHRRRDLGRVRLGPLLGLGPQGDRRLRRVGRLRRLLARPRHLGLAHHRCAVDQRRRLRDHRLQPVLHQHGRGRASLVCRAELSTSFDVTSTRAARATTVGAREQGCVGVPGRFRGPLCPGALGQDLRRGR